MSNTKIKPLDITIRKCIDGHELIQLVSELYDFDEDRASLIFFPEGYGDNEACYCEASRPDPEEHLLLTKERIMGYKKWDRQQIILDDLVARELLEPGNYVVEISQ